jgi:hypothetical protein
VIHMRTRLLLCFVSVALSVFFTDSDYAFAEAAGNAFGIDSRCFNQQQCIEVRRGVLGRYAAGGLNPTERPEDGFYIGADATAVCGQTLSANGGGTESMGFCTPIGASVTAVKFAGKDRFAHIADFIKYIYRYGIVIGIVISTIMVIVAGIQWMTSAGGSDGITSAKKKITGSIVGITLLSTSYVILRTVNPALVELRLPQVWMINPIDLAPASCSALDDNVRIAEALPPLSAGSPLRDADTRQSQLDARLNEVSSNPTEYNKTKADAMCGGEYFMQDFGSVTCTGTLCSGPGKVCYAEGGNAPACVSGTLVGTIANSAFDTLVSGGWLGAWKWEGGIAGVARHGWAINTMEVYGVCQNGDRIKLDTEYERNPTDNENINMEDKTQVYAIVVNETEQSLSQKEQSGCSQGTFKGFILQSPWSSNWKIEFTHEDHAYGRNGNSAVDIGDCDTTERFLFGTTYQLLTGSVDMPACLVTLPRISSSLLISREDILNGIVLNIDLAGTANVDGEDDVRVQAYSRYGFTRPE